MSWFRSAQTSQPTARTAELIVEEMGDELLVYDQRNDQVHCLSSTAGKVWRACDGTNSSEQLGGALQMEAELVNRALAELEACGLLEGEAAAGMTRREATTRFAKIGAAAAAGPLIASVVAPTPALALTPCGTGGLGCQGFFPTNSNSSCPTRNCANNGCACCITTVKCHLNNTGSAGAYAACIGATTCSTACPSSATGFGTISAACALKGYNLTIDCAGNLSKTHCFTS